MLARIHADANRSSHRKPLKRLGRSAGAPCTQLKLAANLMVRKREVSGLIPPNDAGQWRRDKGVRNWTEAESRRPLYSSC